MALDITPGPLPDDGQAVDVSPDLTAFVEGTTFDNFDLDNFTNTWTPFLISQTEPPAAAFRRPGTLWFKRGEGRLYMWTTALPSSATIVGPDVGADPPVATGEVVWPAPGADWVSLSDRREVYVRYFGNASEQWVPPYGIVSLGWGSSLPPLGYSGPDVNPRSLLPRARSWGTQIQPVQFFANTTSVSLPGRTHVVMRGHDLGYRFLTVASDYTGPGYGIVQNHAAGFLNDDWRLRYDTRGNERVYDEDVGQTRFLAYITESGAGSTTTDAGKLMFGFFFAAAPRADWD